MNSLRLLLVSLLALSLLACGSEEDAGGAGELTDRSTYPAGPYGKGEGEILENLSFGALDGAAFELGSVFAEPKNRVLLLTTTAGWCTACLEEQPKLKALHAEYEGRGLAIVAALFQDANFEPATLEQLQAWQEQHDLPYPIVLDAYFQLGAYYDERLTPMNMIVDVDTMEILKITTGFDETLVRGVIEANLDP